ncbi:retrovirus-related pol polyprotein from transposon TNT 1-94 [Tanacetum coccineum]
MEGLISDDESSNDCWKRWKSHEIYYHDYDEGEYENETHEEGHELCGIETREVLVCQIKRYKMIKYSFNDEEEYVAVKENEYNDLTIKSDEACRAYQEIFRMMDEGWMDEVIALSNDQVAKIMGYGDYQIGNVTISKVYYVEGLGHNLFSVGQFYDSDLEVAFRKHTCLVSNLEGVDLLSRSRGTNLYSLSIGDMMASSPICLLSKATKTKSWLWHRRLSHLNFGALNHLARNGLVRGLPRLKFKKDHLCSACAMGKSKKQSHKPKSEYTKQEKLYLLHMDLCGPMHVASVNG